MLKNKILLLLIFMTAILSLLKAEDYRHLLKIGKNEIRVEIADDDEKRAVGLMYRKTMPDSCGMLFIHDYSEVLSYWMKNTYLPLSIAFLDNRGIIVAIKDMQPLNLASVQSDYPALYALETNQGWFKKHKIKVGDKVEF